MQEILSFIEFRNRFPLLINPGRDTGKTTTANNICQELSKHLKVLLVVHNRDTLRHTKSMVARDSYEVVSLSSLNAEIRTRVYDVIVLDEPGLADKNQTYLQDLMYSTASKVIFGKS